MKSNILSDTSTLENALLKQLSVDHVLGSLSNCITTIYHYFFMKNID